MKKTQTLNKFKFRQKKNLKMCDSSLKTAILPEFNCLIFLKIGYVCTISNTYDVKQKN